MMWLGDPKFICPFSNLEESKMKAVFQNLQHLKMSFFTFQAWCRQGFFLLDQTLFWCNSWQLLRDWGKTSIKINKEQVYLGFF